MKNFMADDEFSLLARSLLQHRSALFKTIAGVVLVLILIGLGLEAHYLLPPHKP